MNHDTQKASKITGTPHPTDKSKHSGTGMTEKDVHGSHHAAVEGHRAHGEPHHKKQEAATEVKWGDGEQDGAATDENADVKSNKHPDMAFDKRTVAAGHSHAAK